MVTGGDALVQVTGPDERSLQALRILLNGRDITQAFRGVKEPRSMLGLATHLNIGHNALELIYTGSRQAALDVTNYPMTGPVLSGPHQSPFVCQTEFWGLGPALDSDCTANTRIEYQYWSTAAGKFKPFDPSGPRPSDIEQTKTSDGHTVDNIVRKETGTINRAVYEIAFLHQPGQPLPDPWTASPGWNGRLVYTFGGGCSAGYRQATTTGGVLNNSVLSQGYAVASSTFNVFGNNCNDVLSAETLMMVKEYFIKRFGVPVHTIGWGGSGGSMQQHLIAQDYPGLLDGIMPSISYPDIYTVAAGALDCSLLAHAFDTSSAAWTEDQKTAVSGFSSWGMCTTRQLGKLTWIPSTFSPGWVNPANCDKVVPSAAVYNADKNSAGTRCTIYDNAVNILGKDRDTGFASRLLDNSGVQYGLAAFNAGRIDAAQFLDLNERVGGYDVDGQIGARRMTASASSVQLAYQAGRINSGSGGLAATPIFDMRPYLDNLPDLHDRFRSFSTRARLTSANGNAENQVMFTMPTAGFLYNDLTSLKSPLTIHLAEALPVMDQWLNSIQQDQSNRSAAEKVARNKPAGLQDACWNATGEKLLDGKARPCETLYPFYGDPRIAAGAPIANNIVKCTLKQIDAKDYRQPLTPDQIGKLRAIFPAGVCDYSRPGVGQQTVTQVWRKY